MSNTCSLWKQIYTHTQPTHQCSPTRKPVRTQSGWPGSSVLVSPLNVSEWSFKPRATSWCVLHSQEQRSQDLAGCRDPSWTSSLATACLPGFSRKPAATPAPLWISIFHNTELQDWHTLETRVFWHPINLSQLQKSSLEKPTAWDGALRPQPAIRLSDLPCWQVKTWLSREQAPPGTRNETKPPSRLV